MGQMAEQGPVDGGKENAALAAVSESHGSLAPVESHELAAGRDGQLCCPVCLFALQRCPPASGCPPQDGGAGPAASPRESAVRVGAMALGIMSRLIQVVRMLHQVGCLRPRRHAAIHAQSRVAAGPAPTACSAAHILLPRWHAASLPRPRLPSRPTGQRRRRARLPPGGHPLLRARAGAGHGPLQEQARAARVRSPRAVVFCCASI